MPHSHMHAAQIILKVVTTLGHCLSSYIKLVGASRYAHAVMMSGQEWRTN